jgi:cytochrome c553/enamine deaminase RidA (YjgF/YER057c/UK114 family)
MLERIVWAMGLACCCAGAAAESLPPAAADFGYCTECHGTEAQGNAVVGAPNLTVLSPWYLREALQAYRSGRRGLHAQDLFGAEMQPIAAALDEAAIDAAVAYIASLEADPRPDARRGDAVRGATLYGACAGCHGAQGEGSAELGAPALAGQDTWYIERELRAYRKGVRGGAGDDLKGRQMRAAVLALEDESAIDDVVAYVAAFRVAAQDASGPGADAPATALVSSARKSAAAGGDGPMPQADGPMPQADGPMPQADGSMPPADGSMPQADSAIVRHPLPGGSTFPIASAVEVRPGAKLLFHSGLTPQPANPQADPGSPEYFGDTKTQTLSVFRRMQASLESMGYSFADIVKMNVFLVGDPQKGGAMDFAGFMAAYTQFFGTDAQPNLPARSAVQVARLANPMALVEIEVIAAK